MFGLRRKELFIPTLLLSAKWQLFSEIVAAVHKFLYIDGTTVQIEGMLHARTSHASKLIFTTSSQLRNDIKTASQLLPKPMLPDLDKTKRIIYF